MHVSKYAYTYTLWYEDKHVYHYMPGHYVVWNYLLWLVMAREHTLYLFTVSLYIMVIYIYMYIYTDIYIRIQRLILYPFIIVVVTQGKITRPTTRGVRRVWYRAGSVSEPVTIFWVSWNGQYPIARPTSRTCPTNPLMNTSTERH